MKMMKIGIYVPRIPKEILFNAVYISKLVTTLAATSDKSILMYPIE